MSYCHYLRKYLEGLQESELLIYTKEENRHHNQGFLSLKCLTVTEAEIHFFQKKSTLKICRSYSTRQHRTKVSGKSEP